jgi:hypothetical protein
MTSITAQRALAASALAAQNRIAGADYESLLDQLDALDAANEAECSEQLAQHIEAIRHIIEG